MFTDNTSYHVYCVGLSLLLKFITHFVAMNTSYHSATGFPLKLSLTKVSCEVYLFRGKCIKELVQHVNITHDYRQD